MRPDNALCRAAGFSRIPMFQRAHSFIISTTFTFQEFQGFKERKPVLLLSLPLSICSPAKVKVSQYEGVSEELCPSRTIVQLKQHRKLLKWDYDQYFIIQKHNSVDCFLLI